MSARMYDDPNPEDDQRYCIELLAKLERPLSFIGEKRNRFILFKGQWMDVDRLLEDASKDPRKRDGLRQELMGRLGEIKEQLTSTCMTREEAIDLFEEGVAVKRAIHLLGSVAQSREEDPHSDIRRWLAYGRRIS
ncbi:MAG: hypothetical protein JXA22_01770 [Candidatus Thermoplasmatota archaeon]|nr:hypothetical protein [Candidatus Thermoplasmatota archaeon]